MDLNDGVWEAAKHLWEIIVAALSAAFSFIVYRHKKNQDRVDVIDSTLDEHHTILKVFEERMSNLSNDISEIKKDLKKILFKL